MVAYIGGSGAVIDNLWSVWNATTRNKHTSSAATSPTATSFVLGTPTGATKTTNYNSADGENIQMTAAGSNDNTTPDWSVNVNGNEVASGLTRVQAASVTAPVIIKQNSGNLYGGLKDTNLIREFLPRIGEFGGRVNRVGIRRKVIRGEVFMCGIYTPLTQDALQFDKNPNLLNITVDLVTEGAQTMNEAYLQSDLLLAATGSGTVTFAGDALTLDEVNTGISYLDLERWGSNLTKAKVPKRTKMIKGSTLVDTVTLINSWFVYISQDMHDTLKRLEDSHGERAWIPTHKYASQEGVMEGEVGSISHFRCIVNLEMQTNATASGKNAEPILLIGDEAFATISFMGSSSKPASKVGGRGRYITHLVKPGTSDMGGADPSRQTGYFYMGWYYGFMTLRNERLGVFWSLPEAINP